MYGLAHHAGRRPAGAALLSDEGARAGVAVAYTIGAILLVALASWMWRRPAPGARA